MPVAAFAQGGAQQPGKIVAAVNYPQAATPQKINPTGKDVTLTVPLRENSPLGEVQVLITADDKLSVLGTDLTNALARVVRPDSLAKLKALADKNGYISFPAAAGAGFALTYDPNAIELVVEIPLVDRLTTDIALGTETSDVVLPDESAPIGAFFNYRVGENYQFDGTDKGKTSLLANLELSGRVADTLAFENFATIDQQNDNVFSRQASRLIYDIPGPALRITAGDLNTESTAFQSSPQIAGINVSHLLDTFYPSSAITGVSSRTLNLTRASNVQILINNQPVTMLRLNPGNYNLRNLPIAQGANNVQAVITDDTGQRVVQNFNFFSDANLLTPGLDEYTGSLGILSPLGNSGPDYKSDEPVFSGFYRRGLTAQITGGANAQATREDQMVGVDAVLGTGFGLFSLDVSGNHTKLNQTGEAARLQYRFADDTETDYFARTYNASAEFRSKHFFVVDDNQFNGPGLLFNNDQKFLFSGSVTQPLSREFSLQFNGDYQINRTRHSNTGDASLFLDWEAPFDTTIGLGVSYRYSQDNAATVTSVSPVTGTTTIPNEKGFSISLTLTHRFDDEDVLTASGDRFQQRVDFNRSPTDPIGDVFANADVSRVNSATSSNATVGYETNRGDIEATYNNNVDSNGKFTSQQGGVFFDGAVAFADGHLALGRHVSDSFAIISEDPSLGDRTVYVQSRFANQVTAETGSLGPAVPSLSSYTKQVIPYDVQNLPMGYNLGSGNFEVYPWLHAGFARTVGSAYNVTAIGTLLDETGNPVVLRTGTATSETDKTAPVVQVVTNRTGRFAAPGLAPGRYRLTIPGPTPLNYEITITKAKGALVRMQELKPEAANSGDKP